MIKVTAAHDRRRAGRFFPKGQPVFLDPDELSEADALAILSDHILNVVPVEPDDVPAEKPAQAPAEKKAGNQSAVTPDPKPELTADERLETLLDAIPLLTDDQKNKDGTPNLNALSERVGFKVTRDELNAALDALTAPAGEPANT